MDNWSDRRTHVCETCMWFVPKGMTVTTAAAVNRAIAGEKDAAAGPTYTLGRCRRHAPTLGGWPVVYDSDWCGDHKLR